MNTVMTAIDCTTAWWNHLQQSQSLVTKLCRENDEIYTQVISNANLSNLSILTTNNYLLAISSTNVAFSFNQSILRNYDYCTCALWKHYMNHIVNYVPLIETVMVVREPNIIQNVSIIFRMVQQETLGTTSRSSIRPDIDDIIDRDFRLDRRLYRFAFFLVQTTQRIMHINQRLLHLSQVLIGTSDFLQRMLSSHHESISLGMLFGSNYEDDDDESPGHTNFNLTTGKTSCPFCNQRADFVNVVPENECWLCNYLDGGMEKNDKYKGCQCGCLLCEHCLHNLKNAHT